MTPRIPLLAYAGKINAGIEPQYQVPYEKLERLAAEGKLTGAYKQGRMWWINLEEPLPEVITLSDEQEGIRNSRADRRQVLRPVEGARRSRVRRG